jgi:hypothetical protein
MNVGEEVLVKDVASPKEDRLYYIPQVNSSSLHNE